MIIQNNSTPLVFLALIILVMAVIVGTLLSGTELLNPTSSQQEAYATGTLSAMSANATQSNWATTQTSEKAVIQAVQTKAAIPIQATQTSQALIAQETVIAHNRISTAEALQDSIIQGKIYATQVSIAGKQWSENQERFATATAIAEARHLDIIKSRNEELSEGLDLTIKGLLVTLLILTTTLLTVHLIKSLRSKEKQASRRALPS